MKGRDVKKINEKMEISINKHRLQTMRVGGRLPYVLLASPLAMGIGDRIV